MTEEALEINLKILSPSSEISGGVSLPNLPASTTVKELRLKIQDAVPSKPAPERMRLIYRGRVVANERDTLADIFGIESIRESRDQTLHLVLPELPNTSSAPSPAPRSATAPPPNPFRPNQDPPPAVPLQTNPFRALPLPRPNSQPPPPIPQPHHHHPHHHHHHHPPQFNPFGPAPPIPLPPHLQQQFAQAMAQNAQHLQAQGQAHPHGPTRNPESGRGIPAPGNGTQSPAGPQSTMGNPQPPNTTRTVRQEGIGPNGERWTVTWNNTNVTIPMLGNQQPILPRPFPHPPGFPLPAQRTPSPAHNVPDQMLARIRGAMDYARQEMENVRILLQPLGGQAAAVGETAAANPPPWRVNHIRQAVRNLIRGLDSVDSGLASLVADPLMAQNRDFVSLQQSATELRGQARDFNRMLDRLGGAGTSNGTPSATSGLPTPTTDSRPASAPRQAHQPASAPTLTQQPASASTQTPPAPSGFPPELFILSSPQGPVGVLFDQRGTYSTAPMLPTMPFQTFSQQFSSNRQLIAGMGQQMAQNIIHIPDPHAAQTQQPATAAQPAEQPQDQNNVQNEHQHQNQNENPPAPVVADNDRAGVIAGHLWLLLKFIVFIWFFAGNGGWYRPLMLGSIAGIVYLAQIGLFENQFNLVRRHFEALLPLAADGVAAAHRDNPNGGPAQSANRTPSPEEAARRLVQQRRDQRFGWVRDSMRTTERAFALFVASLWPGIGERMVRAQEDRERAERAAEEERQRVEEEEAQRSREAAESKAGEEEEAQRSRAAAESKAGEEDEAVGGVGSSAKGKEKVEVEGEGEGEGEGERVVRDEESATSGVQ